MVRFPRIWMSSGECRFKCTRVFGPPLRLLVETVLHRPPSAVAERDDILTTLDVFASRQLQNQHLVERCDGLEVEAVEAFDGGDPERPRLYIVDGAKALSKAIRRTFGRAAALQRCQVHKGRNITDRLDESLHAGVRKVLRQAWQQDDAAKAERLWLP